MSTVELVRTRTLDELAETAQREHLASEQSLVSALAHAVACGEAIHCAHTQLTLNSDWLPWLAQAGLSRKQAVKYERLFKYRDILPPEVFEPYVDAQGGHRHPTANRAFKYLKGLPAIAPRGPRSGQKKPTPDSVRSEIRRLADAGVPHRDIAEMLGVSAATAALHSEPGRLEAFNADRRRRKAEAAAARAALQREREAAAVKTSGDAIAEVYSYTRRSLRVLERMLDEAEDAPRYRRKLNALIADLHKVEDAVVAIIKDADR